MDREIEEQIDELIQKTTKDLKSKILKIFLKNQTKLIKEHAKDLKSGINVRKPSGRKPTSSNEVSTKKSSSFKKDKKNYSDSEYSE